MAKKQITGTVNDSGGPLFGASIVIQGPQPGTTTDEDGKYQIEASVGDRLEFSFIGYTVQFKNVGQNNTIDVVLEELIGD